MGDIYKSWGDLLSTLAMRSWIETRAWKSTMLSLSVDLSDEAVD